MNDLTTSTTARTIPIDDILDEFDDRLLPPSGAQSTPAQDLQDLTKQWIAERGAPEILPYQGALLDRVMERVREQVRHFFLSFSYLAYSLTSRVMSQDRGRRTRNG